MGNTPSNNQQDRDRNSSTTRFQQRSSPSPTPNQPHRSLRHKKRSLELPDLQLDITPRRPAATASIPIPTAAEKEKERERPRTKRQQSGLGSKPTSGSEEWSRQVSYLPPTVPPSSLVDAPHTPPERDEPYQQQIVRSTLPLPLAVETAISPIDTATQMISVPIIWTGGGTRVFLSRAGDDDWKTQIPMRRMAGDDGKRWTVDLQLQPGTHHMRFFVDEQWRVADDLPQAVDDQGSLANYVSVGLSSPPPAQLDPSPPKRSHSFWSTTTGGSTSSPSTHTPALPAPSWTNVIPLELTEAAAEEDAYLNAHHTTSTTQGGRKVVNGFIPAPNIPPAPPLPRHLEKLILNTASGQSQSGSSSGKEGKRSRGRHGSHGQRRGSSSEGTPASGVEGRVLPVTTASGTDINNVFSTGSAFTPSTHTPAMPQRNLLSSSTPNLNNPTPSAIEDDTVIVDDTSVLPVPSHVVLNHLSTSSIRNGVLAVSGTVRYRNKFLTTIYYKPT